MDIKKFASHYFGVSFKQIITLKNTIRHSVTPKVIIL